MLYTVSFISNGNRKAQDEFNTLSEAFERIDNVRHDVAVITLGESDTAVGTPIYIHDNLGPGHIMRFKDFEHLHDFAFRNKLLVNIDFGLWFDPIGNAFYTLECAEIKSRAELTGKEKALKLLSDFRMAYINLCDAWNGDCADILSKADKAVGGNYFFPADSLDELGIDDWAWDMLAQINGDENHLF